MTEVNGTAHAIRITGLSKQYGTFRAMDEVSLDVAPGEFLTLLGPSGSGKTTVLMALAGFVEPTHGDIVLDGQSIVALPPERRDFGVVFQGYALFPHMTVADNVGYPLKVRGAPKEEIRRRVAEALDLVQLGAFAGRMPKQLSGGQQQRVALARALVFRPKVMLLDEPMGALDKKLRHDLQGELRALQRRLGATFVNVTHDQDEAMTMSDRIAIMRAGRIVQIGAPRDLYERPRSRFVADFLGKSTFLAGTVGTRRHDEIEVVIDGVSLRHRPVGRRVPSGDPVTLALRPHRPRLLAPGDGADLANRLPGKVASVVFVGSYAEMTVKTALATPIEVAIPVERGIALPPEGAEVAIGWGVDAAVDVEED
jgi:putative spermidine/putrescine transport system ATP-binding protein